MVQELLEYDWTRVILRRGVVSIDCFLELSIKDMMGSRFDPELLSDLTKKARPESWCGSVTGGNVVTISEEEAIKILEGQLGPGKEWQWDTLRRYEALNEEKPAKTKYYVERIWAEPYHDSCKHFWSNTIPRLLALGKPDEIRIVFFFDN